MIRVWKKDDSFDDYEKGLGWIYAAGGKFVEIIVEPGQSVATYNVDDVRAIEHVKE